MTSTDLSPDNDDQFGDGDIEDEEFLLAESTASQDKKRPNPFASTEATYKKAKPSRGSPSTALSRSILKSVWGFPSFRLEQEAAIGRLISGGSAVVIFPTGGGKSLVYQVPALAFDKYDQQCGLQPGQGLTLVVSPLIALMKDQVDVLRKRRVAATVMDSSQSRDSYLETVELLKNNKLKLLYVAPERLNNEVFIEMISSIRIRLVAIDEAHCISEWGHAFRPDYLKVARFTREVGAERVLCLTATATPKVADDICAAFNIDTAGIFRTSTYRPNLRQIVESYNSELDKQCALKEFLSRQRGSSIVYVQTHNQTETISKFLKMSGLNAFPYHAGLYHSIRTDVQERFMKTQNTVIVATIAFGMGIDKPNIRSVVHYCLPKSLEGYSQQIGRAGRDGLESTCLTYLCAEDLDIMEQWSRADMVSFRAVAGLVGEMLGNHQHAQAGDIIERDSNDESSRWDFRINALGLLNAQLELRFGLMRAITPKYGRYKYAKSDFFEQSTADNTKVTKAVKQLSKTAKTWTEIDVDQAARVAGVDRALVVRKLQQWSTSGAIELRPSAVVNRFRILKSFPRDGEEHKEIFAAMHAYFERSEQDVMARIQDVIGLMTAKACISRGLAKYFGDEESVAREGCGHCSFCYQKTPVLFDQSKRRSRKGRITAPKVIAVLAAVKARDDPRFLAKVAFGISSPRVALAKLGKHPVFGSMDNCDFDELVDRFQQACNR